MVVVVVLVVVEVVVLVVDDLIDDAARLATDVEVAAPSDDEPSSRPWNTTAEIETTATATTRSAPITHARVPNRPTTRESAPRNGPLRAGQPFFGISRNGLPLLVSGSFGRPSTRSPMMFFWISSVPP